MVERHAITERIRAYQFALYDLGLYQDSHPNDQAAMQLRRLYEEKLQKLIDEYEQCYGTYVQTQADVQESWTEWVNGPWPWDVTCCTEKGRG